MKQKDHIVFNSDKHEYMSITNNTDYKSVSKFISMYNTPFDVTGAITMQCAKRDGVSVDVLKAKWKAKADRSLYRGNEIHLINETYLGLHTYKERLKYKKSVESNEFFADIPFDYLEQIKRRKCILHIEDLLYLDNKQLAGQSDLVLEYKNHIEIEDWKTNEKDDFFKSYGNMLEIFKEFPQCSYYTYAIQLVLYGMMAEKLYGKPCKKYTINHIYNGFKQYVIPNKVVRKIRAKLNFLFV
jgi:hypothetical protein